VGRRKLWIEPRRLLQLGERCVALIERQVEPPERQVKVRVAWIPSYQPLSALCLPDVRKLTLVKRRVLAGGDFEVRERQVELAGGDQRQPKLPAELRIVPVHLDQLAKLRDVVRRGERRGRGDFKVVRLAVWRL
jgi:hypothetical protein